MYDRFERQINYLRLSVTDLCNLRCTYCMPAEGVCLKKHEDILSFEEIVELTKEAIALGVNKVRITGGEPLVRRGIIGLVQELGKLNGIDDFAMTTNGILLPRFAQDLRNAGIRRLNISLDTLDPERFREITRGGNLQEVLTGIEAAVRVGFSMIKLNCVISDSPDEADAQSVASYGKKHGLEVRYIRRMNTKNGQFWRVFGGDGGHCENCNRLRVSSDGRIYPCLFSDLNYDVRAMGTRAALLAAVEAKPESGETSKNEFYSLGG